MERVDSPIISVIIPSYKRIESLERLLYSIEEQTFKDYEIIVVNDDSESPLKLDLNLSKEIVIINNSSNLGVNFSRTIGSRAAKGRFLFFVDDDNVMPENLLENLSSAFHGVPKNVAVLAPIAFYLSRPDNVWWSGTKISRYSLFTRFVLSGDMDNSDLIYTQDVHNAFAVRREFIDAMYGIDKRFKRTYSTVVFAKRLIDRGFKLALAKGCKIFHDVPISDLSKIGLLISHVKAGRLECDRWYHYYYEPILYSKLYNHFALRLINSIFQIFRGIVSSFITIVFDKNNFRQRLSRVKCIFAGQLHGMFSTVCNC